MPILRDTSSIDMKFPAIPFYKYIEEREPETEIFHTNEAPITPPGSESENQDDTETETETGIEAESRNGDDGLEPDEFDRFIIDCMLQRCEFYSEFVSFDRLLEAIQQRKNRQRPLRQNSPNHVFMTNESGNGSSIVHTYNDFCCLICTFDIGKEEDREDVKIRVLTCKHIFHQSCIDQWLTRHSSTCPYCKTELF